MALLLLALTGCGDPACKDACDTAAADTADTADTSGDSTDSGDTGEDSELPDGLHGTPPKAAVPAPYFEAANYDGSLRDHDDLVGHPTVLWFYPAATTGGCTVEGCGYRDLYEEFQALGVEIVGVSFDEPAVNQAWAEDEGFQYELWTEGSGRTLAFTYQAVDSMQDAYMTRVTALLDSEGDLTLSYLDSIDVGTHPQDVLDDCLALWGE
jgi:peroxiredoxin Q/BCP